MQYRIQEYNNGKFMVQTKSFLLGLFSGGWADFYGFFDNKKEAEKWVKERESFIKSKKTFYV